MSDAKQTVTKLPNKERFLAVARDKLRTKKETSELAGQHGENVRAFLESGHGDRKALALLAHLINDDKSEISRRQLIDQIRFACEVGEEHLDKTGHTGDLATNAERAAAEAEEEGDGEEGTGGEGTSDPAGINRAIAESDEDLARRRAEQTKAELDEADAATEAKAKGKGKAKPSGVDAINSIATATIQ